MKFEPKNLGCVVCKHVYSSERPVLLVTHYDNGDWSFSCGKPDHSDNEEAENEYFWIGVGHLTDEDSALHTVANLPLGWSAERTELGTKWNRFPDAGKIHSG